MTIPKLMLMMVCLMCVPMVSKEVPKEAPKEAKVTPLFSKDLADLPNKEGVMITVECPPGSTDPIHHHKCTWVYLCAGRLDRDAGKGERKRF